MVCLTYASEKIRLRCYQKLDVAPLIYKQSVSRVGLSGIVEAVLIKLPRIKLGDYNNLLRTRASSLRIRYSISD